MPVYGCTNTFLFQTRGNIKPSGRYRRTIPDKVVIVEIDEFQHKQYAEECECARISELVCAVGGRPLTIIRYNPDSVRGKHGRVRVEPADRIDLLIKTVTTELERTDVPFGVEVIQLWYDDTDDEYQKLKRCDITSVVAV